MIVSICIENANYSAEYAVLKVTEAETGIRIQRPTFTVGAMSIEFLEGEFEDFLEKREQSDNSPLASKFEKTGALVKWALLNIVSAVKLQEFQKSEKANPTAEPKAEADKYEGTIVM